MKKTLVAIVLSIGVIFFSCTNNQSNTNTDTPKKGTIYISVDESFKPVIQEQIKVYEASYPGTKIIAAYKPEVDCFKDLLKDSTRMIITARGLQENESKSFQSALSFKPQYDILAYDAVAVIVNIHSKDSVFTIKDLKDILSGKKTTQVVMDGNNATSTVRYIQDSLINGMMFGKNVQAATNSEAVIEAIAKTENAIGFVGLSWVGNPYDTKQIENLKTIRLALVECVKCEEKGYFAKPSQASIAYAQYPLARPLYYILKENYLGLGSGFVNYLSYERGQLVFRRSFLVPAKMNFNVRNSILKE
ncbi:MAG: substrate-binding domain-containing protein [Bacteroidetes bacterium]|nr:substrate-binding domain-containing protein [Bacteroidota bacterium]MBS1648433.1 substrate-binding domain-containing protein [Bacteroidota bacterium]